MFRMFSPILMYSNSESRPYYLLMNIIAIRACWHSVDFDHGLHLLFLFSVYHNPPYLGKTESMSTATARADTMTASWDVSTQWSIDWFPATIWYEIQQGCYFISKMEAFSLINILLKNNLSNNWNNPIWGSNMTENRLI